MEEVQIPKDDEIKTLTEYLWQSNKTVKEKTWQVSKVSSLKHFLSNVEMKLINMTKLPFITLDICLDIPV